MRTTVWTALLAAATSAGCLRTTQFQCAADGDCGAGGVCEPTSFCSFLNESACGPNGRLYGDSAGRLAGTCADSTDPQLDAGVDAAIDAPPTAGCPGQYVAVAGQAHLYTRLVNVEWQNAAAFCKQTSSSAYLAVPDDAGELTALAGFPGVTVPFWLGLDDRATEGTFLKQSDGAAATFLPFDPGELAGDPADHDCARAISGTALETDKCSGGNTRRNAICECEP